MNRNVVVWGNCQAEPLATLLTEPLSRAGLTVIAVPPVFLIDDETLRWVHGLVAGAALLLSQPIRDEYRVAGCGTAQLAALLPSDGRLIRLPSAFDTAAFPFQCLAHDGSGQRIAAPVTDYHDLRLIVAAARGVPAAQVLDGWPQQPAAAAFDAHAEHSWQALLAREKHVDVTVSPVIRDDAAMFALNHPSNRTLGHVADQVLRLLGHDGAVELPEREFLGGTRTAVEPLPADRLGWTRTPWRLHGSALEGADLVRQQLAFYADRPDVVADSLTRFAARIELLGLLG